MLPRNVPTVGIKSRYRSDKQREDRCHPDRLASCSLSGLYPFLDPCSAIRIPDIVSERERG